MHIISRPWYGYSKYVLCSMRRNSLTLVFIILSVANGKNNIRFFLIRKEIIISFQLWGNIRYSFTTLRYSQLKFIVYIKNGLKKNISQVLDLCSIYRFFLDNLWANSVEHQPTLIISLFSLTRAIHFTYGGFWKFSWNIWKMTSFEIFFEMIAPFEIFQRKRFLLFCTVLIFFLFCSARHWGLNKDSQCSKLQG